MFKFFMHIPSLTRCSIALALGISMAGCSSSTTSGIELSAQRGDATAAYADTYSGMLSLTSTADVVGTDSSTDQRTEAVLLEVTADGLVYLTILGVRIHGVVDNNGNWGVQASIRDFQSLVSEKNISRLQDAGCSLDTKAARVQGVVRPPAFSGDVGGVLKCKRAGVTMATLTTSGTLTAPSSGVADDSTADTSTDDSTETVSSNLPPLGPTGIIWKPISEGNRKLVIILPPRYGKPTLTIRNMSGTVIDTGNYDGLHSKRPIYRFKLPGGGYPNPCILRVGTTDYLIRNPVNRVN
jgi:hypothetical protein